jgi:hypothetical protein
VTDTGFSAPVRLLLTTFGVLLAFGAAGLLQVVAYGGPRLWGDDTSSFPIPSPLGELLVFVMPLTVGLVAAAWVIRRGYSIDRLPSSLRIVLVVSAILVWNLAMWVAVNRWGS